MNLPCIRASSCLLSIMASLLISACEKPLSAEEKKQKALETIGVDASATAAIIVSAARSCQVVGVYELEKCSQIKSTLIADQSAQTMATLAVSMRADYWKACQVEFSTEYCGQLIQRAVAIEDRKP
jgi:hypothetical protein